MCFLAFFACCPSIPVTDEIKDGVIDSLSRNLEFLNHDPDNPSAFDFDLKKWSISSAINDYTDLTKDLKKIITQKVHPALMSAKEDCKLEGKKINYNKMSGYHNNYIADEIGKHIVRTLVGLEEFHEDYDEYGILKDYTKLIDSPSAKPACDNFNKKIWENISRKVQSTVEKKILDKRLSDALLKVINEIDFNPLVENIFNKMEADYQKQKKEIEQATSELKMGGR
jgi:hypothetical protein